MKDQTGSMKDIIVFGASGFGREVTWLIERINAVSPTWNLLGFMDDNEAIQGETINGYKVLGTIEDISKYPDAFFVCAIGSSKIREKIVNKMKEINPVIKFGTVIDPSVGLSDWVTIGEGTIICAHTILTVDISIGNHVIINLDCTVGHDAIIRDFVTLYPSVNISGMTSIGRCSELGTGAQVIQQLTICDETVLGAGAVVVKDIVEPGTYVGVPAREVL